MTVFRRVISKLGSWFHKKPRISFPAPIPKATTITARFLQESYFPTQRPAGDELPPILHSKSFTPAVARKISPLMPKKSMGFDAVEYRLTRGDGQIRASHIPHPLAYANLVLTIEKHWNKFPDIFNNFRSYIRPRLHPDGRLIVMKYDSWLTKTLKALGWRLTSRYIAHVDITNFFPSIYTHSFGWAIDGIQVAKKSGGKAWYDDVDKALRLTKRNETNGVLVGPATSNFATEVILGNIDDKLSARGYRFFRHVDDYKCFCSSREEADRFIADMTRLLSYYKLAIKNRKSGVISLPAPDVEPWIAELRILARHLGKRPSSGQISFFLDCVTQVATAHKQENAFKYSATVLSSKKLNENAKVTAFVYLLGMSQFYPNLTSCLIAFLPSASRCKSHSIDLEIVSRLHDGIKFGRSDVTSWLIYLAHKAGAEIPAGVAEQILNGRDCISSLLLFATGDKVVKKKVAQVARDAVKSPDMYDAQSQWLLIYELYRCGAIRSAGADKACFDVMKGENVKFCSLIP